MQRNLTRKDFDHVLCNQSIPAAQMTQIENSFPFVFSTPELKMRCWKLLFSLLNILTKVEIYQFNGNFLPREFCMKKRYFDGNARHAIAITKDLISFKLVSPRIAFKTAWFLIARQEKLNPLFPRRLQRSFPSLNSCLTGILPLFSIVLVLPDRVN